MRLKIYSIALSILIFSVLLIHSRPSEKQKQNQLTSKNYGLLDCKTFYAKNEVGKTLDSLRLYNLTFKVDSLHQINKNLWHFMYSVKCGPGCKIIKQLILAIENGKIQTKFSFFLLSSIDYGNWGPKGSKSFSAVQYQLKKFDDNQLIIESVNLSDKTSNQKKLIKTEHKIKYNKKSKLYCTDRILLKGNYNIAYAPYFDKEKLSINDSCSIIKIKDHTVTHIKDRWFWLNSEKTFVEFL